MDPERARAILREKKRRAALRRPEYIVKCFEEQIKFFDDKSRFKVALCGRRAGKTAIVTRGLLQTAGAYPNTVSVYMGVTRETAKRLIWSPLQQLARAYKLPMKFNKVELIAYHGNGSEIWILGADKEEDIEKCRGPSYKLFAIDEAASYRAFVEILIDQVVEPALGDHRGSLWLTGTPGRACAGYFYDASTNAPGFEKYSVHSWTVLQNRFFHEPEVWLKETRDRKGWSEDHPIYRREYMGEWVEDKDALVYKYNSDRNGLRELPSVDGAWRYVLAIDFGVVDPTAFVVLAYTNHDPNVYIVESYKQPDLSPSDVAEHIQLLRDRYVAEGHHRDDAFEQIIGDTGGMGKAFTQELGQRHQMYVKPAEKREKLAYIDHLNGDLVASRLKVVVDRNHELIREWQTLPWILKDGKTRARYDDRAHDDHLCDAALYGWRECRHYMATPLEKVPEKESAEWWRRYEDELEQREVAEAIAEKEGAWWDKLV